MSLRAVLFDLDDTLIAEEQFARASMRSAAELVPGTRPEQVEEVILTNARALWRAGQHHHVAQELGIASWEGLWASFEGCHQRLDGLAAWAPTYRAQTWQAVLAELGTDEPGLAEGMAKAYEEAQRSGHPLLEGAAAAVHAAGERWRLGLLTNGPPDIQRLKLDQTGLASCFDAVVISGEVGVGKPSPEVFGLLVETLGVRPDEAVMVGDSWERDVEGALYAGLRPIWVAGRRPLPEPNPNVRVIPSIRVLLAVLDEMRS